MSEKTKEDSCGYSYLEALTQEENLFCVEASFKGSLDCSTQACERLMEAISVSPAAEDWFEISLILQEAVNNAVLHGCKDNPDREVKVRVCSDGKNVEVKVSHDGYPWDWKTASWELPCPDSTSGRGLFIIDNYAHEKTISEDGKSLILVRHLGLLSEAD